MYLVLLANDNLLNETQFMRDCTAAIGAACDSIMTDSALVQALIKVMSGLFCLFVLFLNAFFMCFFFVLHDLRVATRQAIPDC